MRDRIGERKQWWQDVDEQGGHVLMRLAQAGVDRRPRSDTERTIFFASDLHGSEVCFKKFVRGREVLLR